MEALLNKEDMTFLKWDICSAKVMHIFQTCPDNLPFIANFGKRQCFWCYPSEVFFFSLRRGWNMKICSLDCCLLFVHCIRNEWKLLKIKINFDILYCPLGIVQLLHSTFFCISSSVHCNEQNKTTNRKIVPFQFLQEAIYLMKEWFGT